MPFQDHINSGSSNRVTEAIFSYAEQDAQLRIGNPVASRNDQQAVALKLQYYSSIYEAHRKSANKEEKLSLRYVRHEIAKMNAVLNPTRLKRFLYSNIIDRTRSFINGNDLNYRHHNSIINNIITDRIREHNLESLTESMKNAGFKHNIEGPLAKMINRNLPQFHLRYADVYHRDTDFVLHFNKIPQTDLYYFEKFEATSRPSLDALLKNDGSCMRQAFTLQDNVQFSSKEAASLVNGRAVCKEDGGKDIWYMTDPAKKGEEYPFKKIAFDVREALKDLPIKGLDDPSQFQAIIDTLKSGQSKNVTLDINGAPLKCKLEAAPKQKTIYVLDKNNRLLDVDRLLRQQGVTRKLAEKMQKKESTKMEYNPSKKIK